MFKFRPGGQAASSNEQPPTIETIRKRARHRLIGASILVLAGVIGFPMVFDKQPRPIDVDMPIDIPAKDAVKPLTSVPAPAQVKVDGMAEGEEVLPSGGAVSQASKPAASQTNMPTPAASAAAPLTATPSPAADAPKPAATAPVKAPEPKAPTPASPPADRADAEAARAMAALEDKPQAKVIVQVGAFADSARAQEVRRKLERAGLKTYTHVAKTAQGERIRVRVGPFATRAEADKAAAKVKSLGLQAAILTL